MKDVTVLKDVVLVLKPNVAEDKIRLVVIGHDTSGKEVRIVLGTQSYYDILENKNIFFSLPDDARLGLERHNND